jgi:hypothetical protein
MQGVDERGHGPDRKAIQKRMRDVDVASVVVGVKRRRRVVQVACGAVLVGGGPAQSQARDQLCPVLWPAACQACVRRGWHGERSDVDAAAARPNLGDGRLLLVLLQGGKANVSARALDWTRQSEDTANWSSSLLTRARKTRRWYWRREGGRRGGRGRSEVSVVAVASWVSVGGAAAVGGRARSSRACYQLCYQPLRRRCSGLAADGRLD